MIIITLLTLIVAISLQTVTFKISPIVFSRITSIFFIYSAMLSFNVLYLEMLGSGIGLYSGYYQVSVISQSIEIFMYIIGAIILMPWYPAQIKNISNIGLSSLERIKSAVSPALSEYSLILLFTTLGGVLLLSSSDLVSMYLSIELQSFAVYILCAINRDSESSTSAGLKYFLLGGLSSCFILLGVGLIYSFTGITNLESLYSLVSVPSIWLPEADSSLFNSLGMADSGARGYLLGLVLIVSGFLFKIAAAPFHNWAPDVYDGTSTIVTTWLTIMPKLSIVIFLLELQSGLFLPTSNTLEVINSLDLTSLFSETGEISLSVYPNVLKNLFLISSLLSLIIGSVVGLAQYKIKRLLAYSTISHVGFLLLALAVNTEQSTESLIFYILQYSITNLNTFLIILVFGYTINSVFTKNNINPSNITVQSTQDLSSSKSFDIRYISELKAQFISNPVLSLSLAICLFSMAGVPPLVGFFAKQQVLYSATYSGYFFLSIVAIIVSVISASYYLQIIKVIHFPTKEANSLNVTGQGPALNTSISNEESLDSNNQNLALVGVQSTQDKVYITNIHSMTISTLTLTILLFIFNPSLILNSTHLMALSIFNC